MERPWNIEVDFGVKHPGFSIMLDATTDVREVAPNIWRFLTIMDSNIIFIVDSTAESGKAK